MASATDEFTSGADERSYIVSHAQQLGLDPRAVLAVAATEGVTLPSHIGDSGTSFGPFQLHAGGALPPDVWSKGASYAQQWANSPAGIDYALGRIQTVAQGLQGQGAISNIVSKFERPADPAAEISRATSIYNENGGPSISSDQTIADFWGNRTSTASQVASGLTKPFKSIEEAFTFLTSWRFVEVVGGFFLLLLGLYLLGRQLGAPSVSSASNALGFGTPAGAARGAVEKLPGVEARQNMREYRTGQRQGRLAASRAEGRKTGSASISKQRRVPDSNVRSISSARRGVSSSSPRGVYSARGQGR